MKIHGIGSGMTIFLLFFGIALLDAAFTAHWMIALFWVSVGGVFLWADRRAARNREKTATPH